MDSQPWYRRTLRWAQTNLVEADPERYDPEWWRAHWKRTRVQGAIINAGGIVAYYPSRFELHHRAETLGDQDLYGDIVKAAREEGLAVIARMDSNRVAKEFFEAHPDWICRDINGDPYRRADKYVTCINSPYYEEYLPNVMREIIERSQPDGFSDNSWAGLDRSSICYCDNCKSGFKEWSGHDLPRAHDWSDEAYRSWIKWNFSLRTRVWELNNAVTMEAGGEHCRWMGMISGDMLYTSRRFIDLREILARTEIVMLDHQRRNPVDGFGGNTEVGKRLHELVGWDKHIPESMPQYQLGSPAFRLSSMPAPEVRLWSSSGFAGGIQPWWHHIGALHEDRRQYKTAEPIFVWHEKNQDILVNRKPQADVGVVWSQENHDYFGQDDAEVRTLNPYRGVTKALDKHGISYIPVHADDIEKAGGRFRVLILPNVGALSDSQATAVEAFANAGGSVIASGETGSCDEDGKARDQFALAKLFGIGKTGTAHGGLGTPHPSIEISDRHTYLRLTPELRHNSYGPKDSTAPESSGSRHRLLQGLDETDTLPFGGYLPVVEVEDDVEVLATFIPDFPIFPPETSWMRVPRTDIPAICVRANGAGARLVWFAADLDRCYARDGQFEHALLIANAVRWCQDEKSLVMVEGGDGFVSPALYEQNSRHILHLNNRVLTSAIPGRQDRLLKLGPVKIHIRLKQGATPPASVQLRVAEKEVPARMNGEYVTFDVAGVLDHEVAVIEWK